MAAGDAADEPLTDEQPASSADDDGARLRPGASSRYRPLPTGTHGLDPELVKLDQLERLRGAMVELVAEKGYPAVRIVDLAKLAHVSQPTFYNLCSDKEALFLSAFDEIAQRAARTVVGAYNGEPAPQARMTAALRSFAELAVAEPHSISLLMLGAFGAGAKALERRRHTIEATELRIQANRSAQPARGKVDLTVKAILGGIREVTAERLRSGREGELPRLVEELSLWAACYPDKLPNGLAAPALSAPDSPAQTSERARRAEGRLPSGRSDLPRKFIVKSQRERIVDATAAIVAEKGLPGLTIPEIARRANVSNQTFYSIYASKHDAFVGAQKVGMHQALQVAVEAYEAHADDWPAAIAAGLRALVDYLASEPAHAHLSLVDTFAASPEAIDIRNATVRAFGDYLRRGQEHAEQQVLAITAEAVAGGVWQVFHHYAESECIDQLPEAAPQLTYFVLTPFIGPRRAARVARSFKRAAAARGEQAVHSRATRR